MAKRYIIEEIRATHWSARVRDAESGEVSEVPLEGGGRWPGRLRSDVVSHETTEAGAPNDEAANDLPRSPAEPPPAEPPAEKKPRKERSDRKGMPRITNADDLEQVMESPLMRNQPLDVETVSDEDTVAFQKMQTLMRRGRGRRAGKRGDLGWDETTDAGRSGLLARFGDGAFKILHAGGDTYALFFEWDDGRYDRLGCGGAEDLMNLANERARSEPPEPPPSHLSLELARLFCGTKEQKRAASEALKPVIAETRPPTVDPAPGAAAPGATAPNVQLDQAISDSLKKALADLEAQDLLEEKTRKERGE
ncbi:MAG: hypothetical protein H0T76_07915 [Nannocystis sp.]|nr:hypothetical protein [Nannocystis sp.]MBA3546391.1 hypothetical protein [Nannocystis sp.]